MKQEDIEQARVWRAQDPPVSWRECGRRLNRSHETVRLALNPSAKQRARIQGAAYVAANPEKKKAGLAAWKAANGEWCRAYHTTWTKANPDKCRVHCAKYYAANSDKMKAAHAAWKIANPGKHHEHHVRRRARKRGAPGNGYTAQQTTWLLEHVYTGGRCAYCLSYGNRLEWDHVAPLARGGSNHPENLVAACSRCNSSKKAKLLTEWRDGVHQHVTQLAIDAAELVRQVFVGKK